MKIAVEPSRVEGRVEAPPSKSYTHRAVLAGALADELRVLNPLESADVTASKRCAEMLGATIQDDVVRGVGGRPETPSDVLDCGNSGTTLRLFTGAASLAPGTTVLTGDDSLRSRPNQPLLDSLQDLGADARSTRHNGQAPLVVEGPLTGGTTEIDGGVSSQFISSLLFASPLTSEGAEITVAGELKSRPYVDITLEVMREFGVDATETSDGFSVDGGQSYSAREFRVPGDFSNASYPLAAGAVAGDVRVANLIPSAQGDSVILDVLDRMGADVDWDRGEGVARVVESDLGGVEFDAGDNPDLVPTIAVLGAAAEGETRVVNAEHLRYKETDRLEAMATELGKMNAEVKETEDGLVVDGDASSLRGAEVSGRHDHRVVMALAVAGLVAEGRTVIDTAEAVRISYPEFTDALHGLGANVRKAD